MKWSLLPKLLATIMLWGAVGYIVLYVDPARLRDVGVQGMYLPMPTLVTLCVWYSALLLTKSFRAATLLAMIVAIMVVTMVMRWMNWMVAGSLVGMTAALGLTLVRKS